MQNKKKLALEILEEQSEEATEKNDDTMLSGNDSFNNGEFSPAKASLRNVDEQVVVEMEKPEDIEHFSSRMTAGQRD